MTLLQWSEHFVTGIDGVDHQHRGLVDLVNAAAPVLIDGDPTTLAAETLLDRLTDYAANHFRDEERLMGECGVDAAYCAQHIRSHCSFVDEVGQMRRQIGGGTFDGEYLLRFLTSWLTFHILVEDQYLARQFRLLAAGQSASAALLLARERRSDSAQAVLTGAVIDLFAVAAQRNRALVESNAQLQAAQARLAELNADLERQVEARTRELQQTNLDLLREQGALHAAMETIERTQGQLLQSEKMAAVGQLAAGVAHEINNPIGFVSSNLGSLEDYVSRLFELAAAGSDLLGALDGDHPARLAAERAGRAAELDFLREDIPALIGESADGLARVRKIVADLKDFSRADNAEWQLADIHQGLASTLNVVASELKYKATLVREFGELPLVRCIPAQLNQVFMNLLVNAGQAIEVAGTITLRTGQDGRWVWIDIEDTGSGIAAALQSRIFEPFFSTKPPGKGTGLGLSISWEIIQRHQGMLRVDSEPGRGSRFRIELPIAGPNGVANGEAGAGFGDRRAT
ncbi:MAG: hemerythrin domain-containing protein [Candidatus Accumulibacter sp. UW20]|jgi:two-component system NtrC family sensor kinase